MSDEKKVDVPSHFPSPVRSETDLGVGTTSDSEVEVFGVGGEGHVEFRTVGWIRAAMFLTKQTFATGVLSMPSAMYYLGAVAGCLFILFWGLLNTYSAYLQGAFKLAHPKLHTIVDASEIAVFQLSKGNRAFTRVIRELLEFLYIMSWILCIGLAVLALGTALNAVSKHATCTIGFNIVAFVVVTAAGSIRKIHGLGAILWVGFVSALASILIVVIGVAVRDRPAGAPATGPYDLGFGSYPPAGTTFAQAWAASLAIYASSANTCGYVPVISEMRRPQDFFKSLYACEVFMLASYMSLATVVYAYCGKWVTSPSLGSAGPTLKIVAYGVAIPGLIAVGMICVHIPAKSIFVRALRGTHHLTENTFTHWVVWFGCTIACGFVGWLLAEAIPFFTSLTSLIGSLGFAPLGICMPPILWFALHDGYRKGSAVQQVLWYLHLGMFLLGAFMTIGGTYANISNIVDQFRAGDVGAAFSCADNSGTVTG